jgi:hypothetical protein
VPQIGLLFTAECSQFMEPVDVFPHKLVNPRIRFWSRPAIDQRRDAIAAILLSRLKPRVLKVNSSYFHAGP